MADLRTLVVSFLALAALSCSAEEASLLVDVRTDYVPGEEFTQVRVTITNRDGTPPVRLPVSYGDDFLSGIRVAEFDALSTGAVGVDVELLDLAENEIATRRTLVQLDADLGIVVILTRSCRGVSCTEPGTTCFDATCVDATCRPGAPSTCPDPNCTSDSDCAARDACSVAVCRSNGCLYEPVVDACGAEEYCDPDDGCLPRTVVAVDGGPDAGPDAAPDTGPDAAPDTGIDAADAAPDTMMGCSGSCGAGCGTPCCADECTSTVCPTCQAGCTCYQACAGADCETVCRTGSECFLESGSFKGTVACDGADCRIDCGDSAFDFDCEMTCMDGASCEMHCDGVDDCEIFCNDTSECLLDCASLGGICAIYGCAAPVSCSATVSVCNRACP